MVGLIEELSASGGVWIVGIPSWIHGVEITT